MRCPRKSLVIRQQKLNSILEIERSQPDQKGACKNTEFHDRRRLHSVLINRDKSYFNVSHNGATLSTAFHLLSRKTTTDIKRRDRSGCDR